MKNNEKINKTINVISIILFLVFIIGYLIISLSHYSNSYIVIYMSKFFGSLYNFVINIFVVTWNEGLLFKMFWIAIFLQLAKTILNWIIAIFGFRVKRIYYKIKSILDSDGNNEDDLLIQKDSKND